MALSLPLRKKEGKTVDNLRDLDMSQAACADADPDTFFPEGKNTRLEIRMAKAICHDCPIKDACLMVALAEGYVGIWGETTDEERREMKRRPIQITR